MKQILLATNGSEHEDIQLFKYVETAEEAWEIVSNTYARR